MNVLILSHRKDFFSKFSKIIESNFSAEYYNVPRVEDAESLVLNEKNFDFIILDCDYDFSEIKDFLLKLQNEEINLPVLFVSPEKKLKEIISFFKYSPLYTYLGIELENHIFVQNIEKIIKLLQRRVTIEEKKYHKLPSQLFFDLNEAPCDIYLELSGKQRKVKVFTTGAELQNEDIKKYHDKGVTYFYVSEEDYLEFTHIFISQKENFVDKNLKTEVLADMSIRVHENLHHFCHSLGVTEEVVQMVNVTIDMIGRTILKGDSVLSKLKSNFKEENYISEHSLMISILATNILRNIPGMGTRDNYMKMCLAALFHDISLESDEWYAIPLEKLDWSKAKIFKEHPRKSVEIINKINGIPQDVEKIIIQHHERPDGTGFPHSLDYNRIAPLSAVFIVAEDLVNNCYRTHFNASSVTTLLGHFRTIYNKGYFKDALIGLEKTMGDSDRLLGAS